MTNEKWNKVESKYENNFEINKSKTAFRLWPRAMEDFGQTEKNVSWCY